MLKEKILKVLRFGIAGYGVVGKRRHQVISQHPSIELVAVCDQDPTTYIGLSAEIRCFSDYRELLMSNLDLDGLLVCMTNDLNPVVTIQALRAGLHVFCEKPPGRSLEDIARVIEVEKQFPEAVLMYGFNHRYHHSVRDALALIRSGDLGKIINLRGVYGKSQLITFNQSDWRTKRAVAGGGVLLDQGIHMVDLIRMFAGEMEIVNSVISNSHWGFDVEDNAYAIMKSEAGTIVTLNSSATQWRHKFHLEIGLELGSVILGGLITGTKSYGDETLTVSRVTGKQDYGNPNETLYKYNEDPSWELELDAFFDAILDKTTQTYGSSVDAYRTMHLVFSIYYADKHWRDTYDIPKPTEIKL